MSKFIKCDRCGEMMPSRTPGRMRLSMDVLAPEGGYDCEECDLCPACRGKLKAWFQEAGE